MPPFVLVLIILLVGLALFWFLLNASPNFLARMVRVIVGGGGLLLALFLMTRGQVVLAVPLAFFAFGFLTGKGSNIFSIFARKKTEHTPRETGNFSEVKTKFLEMKLDHDSGEMEGVVLRGPFAGQRLSRLSVTDIIELRKECLDADVQSVPLLEAFLDHIQPKWREHPNAKNNEEQNTPPPRTSMSPEEALEILGLTKGANEEQIRQAHRNLMKKFHPDQGGSTYLAAKINEAKDLLLRR